jgi:hypothetical protein
MNPLDSELPPGPAPWIKPTDFLRSKPRKGDSVKGIVRHWQIVPGVGYELAVSDLGVKFTVTRVRNRYDEVFGLLTVRAEFKGARTIGDGILSSADFNLSSLRARQERAKHLHERAHADEIDWLGLLEELCLRILEQEDRGNPEQALSDIPVPDFEHGAEIIAGGLPLLRRHPVIWFGDGAAGKSLLALYVAIDLAQSGHRVLYCDWEFSGEEHSARLRRFAGQSPGLKDELLYRRCDKSFVREAIQIRDIIAKRKITYMICDSIGFAAEGAPESAEAATGYFRALRECGPLGSLHLAHMNRSEQGDQKPFGSVFWHAGARATWYLKRTEADQADDMTVGFYHRKSNIGKLNPPFARKVEFLQHETRIAPTEITEAAELSDKLKLWQKIKGCLQHGPMTAAAIAEELEAKTDTVYKTLDRMDGLFGKFEGADNILRFRLK